MDKSDENKIKTETRQRIYRAGYHRAIYKIYKCCFADQRGEFEEILKNQVGLSEELISRFMEDPRAESQCGRNECPDGHGGCIPCRLIED